MSGRVSDATRQRVTERAYRVCEYCLIHEDDTFWGCHIDHIISRKHGGSSELENLAFACAVCNANKGTDIASLAGKPPKLTRLFHPHQDHWLENFHLVKNTIDFVGEIGEATVKLLQLNHPNRVEEREALSQVGRYPTIEALARMKE
jgi:HNH endonuclease